MPDDKELEQKADETKEQYIARLKKRLQELFEQHIRENEGQPLFASDIKDLAQRTAWEARQLAQWNARHSVLRTLVKEGERAREEIRNEESRAYCVHSGIIVYPLEYRQRWLIEEGRAFFNQIIEGLKRKGGQAHERNENKTIFAFATMTHKDRKFCEFYYVNMDEDREYRDLSGADLGKQHLDFANLRKADISYANFRQAHLFQADLQAAYMEEATLEQAYLCEANLQGADCAGAILRRANLIAANLERTFLMEADVVGAILWNAKCSGANFEVTDLRAVEFGYADLRGANISNSVMAGKAEAAGFNYLERGRTTTTSLRAVRYSRAWRGPRLFALLIWLLSRKTLAWHIYRKGHHPRMEFSPDEYPKPKRWYAGRPTTFLEVDVSGLDWSKNPGLKRDIEDEQFIEDFREKHRKVYWLWAMSSDCGRSIGLWASWCLAFILLFAGAYQIIDLFKGNGITLKSLWECLYASVLTFATFGFGKTEPNGVVWEIFAVAEVVVGYIFFGGLVALFTSTLTHRA